MVSVGKGQTHAQVSLELTRLTRKDGQGGVLCGSDAATAR